MLEMAKLSDERFKAGLSHIISAYEGVYNTKDKAVLMDELVRFDDLLHREIEMLKVIHRLEDLWRLKLSRELANIPAETEEGK